VLNGLTIGIIFLLWAEVVCILIDVSPQKLVCKPVDLVHVWNSRGTWIYLHFV